MIGPAQSRAARGLLNWSRAELAAQASVSEGLVESFEEKGATLSPPDATALERAFELARVEFVDGDQAGVRLKPKAISIPIDQLTTDNDK